jgi:hypothetical protein
MFFNRYFLPFVLVMLIVVGLHWIASLYGFYWNVWWYDIMMHSLGGLFVFIAALWALNTQYARALTPYINIKNLLVFVFVIGFLWEVHEILLDFADFSHPQYVRDTTEDFIFDMTGAVAGALIFRQKKDTQDIQR